VLWEEMNSESNKIAAITTNESIVHQSKTFSHLQEEMAAEGEDVEIEFIDEDDIEDLDDFDYEDFDEDEE
jgi:GTP-binding protein